MRKISLIASELSLLLFISAQTALAQITINPQPPSGIINPQASGITINSIVQFIITLLIAIGIIGSLIFLIYGGIKWILSGGDKTAVETARNHIVAAIIGLIIVIASFAILSFVGQLIGVVPPGGTILNVNITPLTTPR